MRWNVDEIIAIIFASSLGIFLLACSYATIVMVNNVVNISQQNNAHNVNEIRIR